MIIQKTGKCLDCDKVGPIIGKRCQFHYWKHRRQVKEKGRLLRGELNTDKYAERKALDKWFAMQIAQMPAACENCGEPLNKFAPWAAKAYVAHILPKRKYKSVMLHPLNRVFLCLRCHTDFDNKGIDDVKKMPVYAIAMERLMHFSNEANINQF